MIGDFKRGIKLFFNFLKQNKKIFIIIFAVYCFAFVAIWRANFYYADDVGRSVIGYGWTSDFGRYSSSALQFFLLNMNLKLVDLSPYTQVFALLLTAFSSFILIYLFTEREKKPSFPTILASAFLGLCPYTIACFVYKFDAPCMALALFATVFPFLFYFSKRSTFFGASLICLLIMWTSYQAYSGVYVVMAIAMAFKSILDKEIFKEVLKRTLFAAFSFFVVVILYKICFPDVNGYRSIEMFSFAKLIPGFLGNLFAVLGLIWASFNAFWKILTILFFGVYLISFLAVEDSWKKKLRNFLFGLGCLFLFVIFSFGAFLLLKEDYFPIRSFCGISVAFTVLGLFTARNMSGLKIKPYFSAILAAPMALLLYQFFVFEVAFGNVLSDQWRYSSFRIEALADDLAELFPDKAEQQNTQLQIQGDIGFSAITAHVATEYPIINELITSETSGLTEHVWGSRRAYYYYDLNFEDAFVALTGRFDYSSMNKIKDTSYHTIYMDDGRVCVVLK